MTDFIIALLAGCPLRRSARPGGIRRRIGEADRGLLLRVIERGRGLSGAGLRQPLDTEGRVQRFTKKFGVQTSEQRKTAAAAANIRSIPTLMVFKKGNLVYLYAALKALWQWKPTRFTLSVDGTNHDFTGYSVAIGNSISTNGGHVWIGGSSTTQRPLRSAAASLVRPARETRTRSPDAALPVMRTGPSR